MIEEVVPGAAAQSPSAFMGFVLDAVADVATLRQSGTDARRTRHAAQ